MSPARSTSKIMDALQQIAVAEGKVSEEHPRVHKIFVDAPMHGRSTSGCCRLKMTTKDLFSDIQMRMFFKQTENDA
jgi:hypothetical protein